MRILAIDYGTKRIGLAVSDPLGIIATGFKTLLHPPSEEALLKRIGEIVKEREVTKVVIGFPLNMNGTKGPAAERVEELAKAMEKALGQPI